MRFALEDIEGAMRAHSMLRRGGVRKAPQQYLDEGLAQHVLLLCVRLQSAPLALGMLRVLERSLSSVPVLEGAAARGTTASGARVPLALTYLSAIHACAGAAPPAACAAVCMAPVWASRCFCLCTAHPEAVTP